MNDLRLNDTNLVTSLTDTRINAHGGVVQIVKDNTVVSYIYDAFGNLIHAVGTSDNAFLYCGEYYDAETGTYYLRARYYDPTSGRFTQQDAWAFMDPSDPLSLNLYTYCANNPVMYIDPSGENPSISYGFTYDLGKGWYARFDYGQVGNQNHVHVYMKNGDEWIMNLDGSMSHQNKSNTGTPPKKTMKKLKEQTGFDYKATRDNFLKYDEVGVELIGLNDSISYYTDGTIYYNGVYYNNGDAQEIKNNIPEAVHPFLFFLPILDFTQLIIPIIEPVMQFVLQEAT